MTTPGSLSQPAVKRETEIDETFTLLDLLLLIVDNLRLVVVGPVVVGLLVFIISSIWPKTYESTAILKTEQISASLMNSAAVIDPVAISLGYTSKNDLDDARRKLKDQIQVRFNPKDKLITLTAQAETPQLAQVIVLAILQKTYDLSRPRYSENNRLQKQLEQAKTREKEANEAGLLLRKKMVDVGSIITSEVAQGYAQIMRVVQESQAAQNEIEHLLIGLDASALVQEATIPTKHTEPKIGLLTIISALTTEFGILLFVLLRNATFRTSQRDVTTQKIAAIKLSWRKFIGNL